MDKLCPTLKKDGPKSVTNTCIISWCPSIYVVIFLLLERMEPSRRRRTSRKTTLTARRMTGEITMMTRPTPCRSLLVLNPRVILILSTSLVEDGVLIKEDQRRE